MGNLLRFITGDGSVVCTVLNSTSIVAEMERIHRTSAVVTAGLGRLITAASMMGSMLKNEQDSVTVRLSGDGPAGTLIAVADSRGNPRGYVTNPIVEIPLNKYGKLDVAGALGTEGTLSVVKDVGLPEPATGIVPLVSGEVAEDVTSYFAVSQQTPTVCALGVLVNPDLSVRAAGGYLLQLLPGAPEEAIERLEANLDGVSPVSSMIDQGMLPEEIGRMLLSGFEPEILDVFDASYRCDCSRARVERALRSLSIEELRDMEKEQDQTEVCCHFCDRKYIFSSADIKQILQQKK